MSERCHRMAGLRPCQAARIDATSAWSFGQWGRLVGPAEQGLRLEAREPGEASGTEEVRSVGGL